MDDTAIKNASARISALEIKIKDLQAELSFAEHEKDQLTHFLNLYAQLSDPTVGYINRTMQPMKRVITGFSGPKALANSKKEVVAEAARDIIQLRGEPVSRASLYQELISRGFTINGRNPEMVLSTMLWRMRNRVVRLDSGGYWLADKPTPDGFYIPALDVTDL